MSDAVALPARPNVEQYRKLAKDFKRACGHSDFGALQVWARGCAEKQARSQGLKITPNLERQLAYHANRTIERWQKLQQQRSRAGLCTLADAQLFIAREHGFLSWPRFVKHLEDLARSGSTVSAFEKAADAISNGDLTILKKLIRENPGLARERSTREHRSTLLHYVSANGIEDFRQKTPKNIVEIAKLLLEAGSDVNAESDAYGGRSTTLGLTATSWHPEHAGVQLPLMKLLIEWGAVIDGPDGGSAVNGCLHNGRGEAAEFFAKHGAHLDLEGAAGVGRLDVVQSFFKKDGTLKKTATPEQLRDGFAWACEFGRTNVVEFLLDHGMSIEAQLRHDGQTGLHWAAFGGHADAVRLLLERGAPIDVMDTSYDGTPLGWALYGWGTQESPSDSYCEVVALLARAGAKLDPEWHADDVERQRAWQRIRKDRKMLAALEGKQPR